MYMSHETHGNEQDKNEVEGQRCAAKSCGEIVEKRKIKSANVKEVGRVSQVLLFCWMAL